MSISCLLRLTLSSRALVFGSVGLFRAPASLACFRYIMNLLVFGTDLGFDKKIHMGTKWLCWYLSGGDFRDLNFNLHGIFPWIFVLMGASGGVVSTVVTCCESNSEEIVINS